MSFWESPSIPNKCRLLRTNEGFGAMVIKARPIGATRCPGKGATRRFTKSSRRSLIGHLQATGARGGPRSAPFWPRNFESAKYRYHQRWQDEHRTNNFSIDSQR